MARLMAALLALVAGTLSSGAHADLIICNKSATRPMSVAWAYQRQSVLFPTPYNVGGWESVAPARCGVMGRGDVHGSTFWLLAVSGDIVVRRGSRGQFSRLYDSTQQFCVSDKKFKYEKLGPGATRDCAPGHYLATFPVTIWRTEDASDLTIDMNPDEFAGSKDITKAQPAPSAPPPDLHGAIAILTIEGQGFMTYASRFENSEAAARQAALGFCRRENPTQPQVCEDMQYVTFRNECGVLAYGPANVKLYSLRGGPDRSERQAVDFLLSNCQRHEGGVPCKKLISACATPAALAAHRKADSTKAQQQLLEALGKALRGQR